MRILQLCKKFPYPLKDGESIAVTHLAKAMNDLGCNVDLLAMNTTKHFFDVKDLPIGFNHYNEIHHTDLDNSIKPFDAFLNLFSKASYHISRFIDKTYADKLKELLKKQHYDIVQLETLYLAPYIPIIRMYSKAIVVMRSHNVEHEIWTRIARNTNSFFKKWYLKHLTNKLFNYEITQLENYDLLVPITDKDYQKFRQLGYKGKSVTVPIGLDISTYKESYESYTRPYTMGYIGSLDWMPNVEGIKWFLENIWESILERFPKLNLEMAGRNTPDWLYQYQSNNLTVMGEVSDAIRFLSKHSIILVPLLSGSGMRAKILESMALGKVVITTSLGLEGIEAKHKEHVLVADTAEEFVESLEYCLRVNGGLTRIGKNARKLVVEYYDNRKTAAQLVNTYQKLIDRKSPKEIIIGK